MGLTWGRTDVGIFRSPKYTVLRKRGAWRGMVAGVAGNLYAVEHETNGFLAHDVVQDLFARAGEESQLADVGLWVPVAGGYEISGYDERQSTTNTSVKGRSGAANRWSCKNGHHDKCRLPGCPCDCHKEPRP